MALITIDDEVYKRFRQWVSNTHDGQTHGMIKYESELALKRAMGEL